MIKGLVWFGNQQIKITHLGINIVYFLQQISSKHHGCDSLLIHLMNSVNKLMIQQAVDKSKLEAKLEKQEEKYNNVIHELKHKSQFEH